MDTLDIFLSRTRDLSFSSRGVLFNCSRIAGRILEEVFADRASLEFYLSKRLAVLVLKDLMDGD